MGCSTSKMFSKKQLRRLRIRNEDVMEMLKLSKDEFNTLSKEFFNLARKNGGMRKGEPVILLDDFVDILGIEVSQFTARVFAMMDDDDSGELDFREFMLACWQFCTHDDSNLPMFAFSLYDDDMSGTLEFSELDTIVRDVYMSRRTARHKTLGHGEASSHPAYEKAIKALEKLGVSKSAGMTMRVEDFVLFCRRSPSLLFPAFTLQAKLRDAICGMKFWKKATKRRVQHGMTAEEWHEAIKFLRENPPPDLDAVQAEKKRLEYEEQLQASMSQPVHLTERQRAIEILEQKRNACIEELTKSGSVFRTVASHRTLLLSTPGSSKIVPADTRYQQKEEEHKAQRLVRSGDIDPSMLSRKLRMEQRRQRAGRVAGTTPPGPPVVAVDPNASPEERAAARRAARQARKQHKEMLKVAAEEAKLPREGEPVVLRAPRRLVPLKLKIKGELEPLHLKRVIRTHDTLTPDAANGATEGGDSPGVVPSPEQRHRHDDGRTRSGSSHRQDGHRPGSSHRLERHRSGSSHRSRQDGLARSGSHHSGDDDPRHRSGSHHSRGASRTRSGSHQTSDHHDRRGRNHSPQRHSRDVSPSRRRQAPPGHGSVTPAGLRRQHHRERASSGHSRHGGRHGHEHGRQRSRSSGHVTHTDRAARLRALGASSSASNALTPGEQWASPSAGSAKGVLRTTTLSGDAMKRTLNRDRKLRLPTGSGRRLQY